MNPNLPTDETMSDGSDISPAEETNHVQEFFDNLSDEEKSELCQMAKDWERSKVEEKPAELDAEGMNPEDEYDEMDETDSGLTA